MVVKEIEVKDIMTKTNLPVSDYAVNPYVGCTHACKYCYASFMKRFTNHPEPWGEFVDVKIWPDIDKPGKYAGKEAFFCSVTDPYQPLEKKYGRTRELLTQLLPTGISISISTKSDLILRDLDLIKQFPSAHVSWSINTLDENFRKEMDRAVSIERRFAAMEQFYHAGIQTTCFISPIFPGITDVKAIIERAKGKCNLVWLENLNLRGDYKGRILDWIHVRHPELDALYREIYTVKKRDYWEALDREISEYTARGGACCTCAITTSTDRRSVSRRSFATISITKRSPNRRRKRRKRVNDMQHACRITVIGKKCFADYQEKYLADPKSGPCPFFNVGDEFILKPGMPSAAMCTRRFRAAPS